MNLTSFSEVPIFKEELESTNQYALELIKNGKAKHGIQIFANHQTQGKGQFNRTWNSEKGKNILMSIILDIPFLDLSKLFYLNFFASLACYDFFANQGVESEKLKIKWPNDIYFENKKIGGILIENKIRSHQLSKTVVGIGLNINQESFSSELNKASSLKIITQKDYDLKTLYSHLSTSLYKRFNFLIQNKYSELLNEYTNQLYLLKQSLSYQEGGIEKKGLLKGVTEKGELIILTKDGEKYFDFRNIKLLC